MGIVFLLISFEQTILPNGIELIPLREKIYAILIGFPENRVPLVEQMETSLVLKQFDTGGGLITYIKDSLNVLLSKPTGCRFHYPLLNLLFGIYASGRGFSLLKIFIPEKEEERLLSILDTFPDTLISGGYILDGLQPVGGFFIVPSKVEGYYNLPPDSRETGFIEFLFLMEIISGRGFSTAFSRTGRKTPFFIGGDPAEIIGGLKKQITPQEMERARTRVLSFYMDKKGDPLKKAVFLSLSGINPGVFDSRWGFWIKTMGRDRIDRLRIKYTIGGVLSAPPSKIPRLTLLIPGSIIDGCLF